MAPYQCPDLADNDPPVLDVIVGQLLAMFRCLQEGLRPDSPSEGGVISRVVRALRCTHAKTEKWRLISHARRFGRAPRSPVQLCFCYVICLHLLFFVYF